MSVSEPNSTSTQTDLVQIQKDERWMNEALDLAQRLGWPGVSQPCRGLRAG